MRIYRFRFFGGNGFLFETRHEYSHDLDALAAAKLFSKIFPLEIWTDGRRVARLKLDDVPLNGRDVA